MHLNHFRYYTFSECPFCSHILSATAVWGRPPSFFYEFASFRPRDDAAPLLPVSIFGRA